MEYQHVQYGYTGILTAVFVAIVAVRALPQSFEDSTWAGVLVALFMVGLVVLTFWFSKLTVTVLGGTVTATFGPGRPHRVMELSDVNAAREVRNAWIQGWGIRKITNGWMYNVWGLDAVELDFTSGRIFRIGTNEPGKLSAAISLSLPG
jgi:hypothetical protein